MSLHLFGNHRPGTLSHCYIPSLTMLHSSKFCRVIFLLLSFTLSSQAMAVASLGSCHRMKALIAVHEATQPTAHLHADLAVHHDGSAHHTDSNGKAPATDDTRVSCAACAACHMSSAIFSRVIVSADIPVAGTMFFPDTEVPRARNIASGLERPPRA